MTFMIKITAENTAELGNHVLNHYNDGSTGVSGNTHVTAQGLKRMMTKRAKQYNMDLAEDGMSATCDAGSLGRYQALIEKHKVKVEPAAPAVSAASRDMNHPTVAPAKSAAAPTVKKDKEATVVSYGVRAPKRGMAREIWDILDVQHAAGQDTSLATLMQLLPDTYKKSNVSIERSCWRKYNGLVREQAAK